MTAENAELAHIVEELGTAPVDEVLYAIVGWASGRYMEELESLVERVVLYAREADIHTMERLSKPAQQFVRQTYWANEGAFMTLWIRRDVEVYAGAPAAVEAAMARRPFAPNPLQVSGASEQMIQEAAVAIMMEDLYGHVAEELGL